MLHRRARDACGLCMNVFLVHIVLLLSLFYCVDECYLFFSHFGLCFLVLNQVSRFFSEVFKELVPDGTGQLLMKSITDDVRYLLCLHVLFAVSLLLLLRFVVCCYIYCNTDLLGRMTSVLCIHDACCIVCVHTLPPSLSRPLFAAFVS